MITVREANDRGFADYGWLKSRHSFSFAEYYNPKHMGYSALRVINDDRVAPGAGFPTHPHRNMEIVSYVLDGAMEHRDSMGHGSVIRPGDVQRMSAGTGLAHSEFNASDTEPLRFLQIWIVPNARGFAPTYEQRHFAESERRGRLRLVASGDGRDGSISLHQDMGLYSLLLDGEERIEYPVPAGRKTWVQFARGSATINGQAFHEGDGAQIDDENTLEFANGDQAELLVFDLP